MLLGINLVTCCTKKQEPRRPVSQTSGEFMKQSVARNKKLNESEENIIAKIIKKDTAVSYIASTKGYWYYYNTKNTTQTAKPIKGNIAFYDCEIKDINGNVIYSQLDLKQQQYVVDKQTIMIGLRDGIKLMQKGETVTFLFPSHMAFGYHGDNKKIGTNEPLICTVTLNDIRKMPNTTQN
ncbi:gliding motility lipoprotein GldI [Flavobacterium psychrophilum]|nr:gliding motility lipoprotein GldI [Flavobacterium psychrophilum]GAW90510.1 gliding motility lipoprotein GldI [Flavobacterium psychrophilum]